MLAELEKKRAFLPAPVLMEKPAMCLETGLICGMFFCVLLMSLFICKCVLGACCTRRCSQLRG